MNILLIGGAGCFIDSIINKLNKEGHRIFLLTGNRYKQVPYQKVFERYDFSYDAECLGDIFDSCAPDVILFMGAFDTNFNWKDEDRTSIKFSNSLTNILMSYAMNKQGRFIFLSSDEVFGNSYEENILENEKPTPATLRGLALSQGEDLCRTYNENRHLDIVTLRLDHYYCIPKGRKDIRSIPSKMCLDLIENEHITYVPQNIFSLLYETDAVEAIYNLMKCATHRHPIYNISSSKETSEEEVVGIFKKVAKTEITTIEREIPPRRCILSSDRYNVEFGALLACDKVSIISKIYTVISNNKYIFLTGAAAKPTFWQKLKDGSGWFFKLLIPFLENSILFVLVFFITYMIGDVKYFEKLDLFLLYVILFAVVYGQQQAIFSAVLATVGYFFTNMNNQTGNGVLLDLNTYIWVAQLFFVGLIVGYLKDQIVVLKNENEEVQGFLSMQLTDMQDINTSNVRVKDALETQLVNQSDSVGKIYKITSELDQYSPEEVLFYAAKVIAELMGTRDVAVYNISNGAFARLFSSTSKRAKSLGNSIVYEEMGELYETVMQHKVYINRDLNESYPLMANGIFSGDTLQALIFVWGIPWERMTLGQANQLTVVSALIKDAVIRANRYLDVLVNQRYVEGSKVLTKDAMLTLIKACLKAETDKLTDCTVLRIEAGETLEQVEQNAVYLSEKIRQSDYLGILEDNQLYVLLSNTSKEEAYYAISRIQEFGFQSQVAEEFEI